MLRNRRFIALCQGVSGKTHNVGMQLIIILFQVSRAMACLSRAYLLGNNRQRMGTVGPLQFHKHCHNVDQSRNIIGVEQRQSYHQ